MPSYLVRLRAEMSGVPPFFMLRPQPPYGLILPCMSLSGANSGANFGCQQEKPRPREAAGARGEVRIDDPPSGSHILTNTGNKKSPADDDGASFERCHARWNYSQPAVDSASGLRRRSGSSRCRRAHDNGRQVPVPTRTGIPHIAGTARQAKRETRAILTSLWGVHCYARQFCRTGHS